MYRFLQRLWRTMVDEDTGTCSDTPADGHCCPHRHRAHRDGPALGAAIAKLIELNNAVTTPPA